MSDIKKIVEEIKKRRKVITPCVVGISGFGGAGKSTLANQIKGELEDSVVISVDNFAMDHLEKRGSDWDGFDWKRFEKEIFLPLSRGGQRLTYGTYNWDENKSRGTEEVSAEVFILEGAGLFRKNFMKYFNYTVWIDCPQDIANARGLKRDTELYRVDHNREWKEIWGPNDQDYFAKHRPDTMADYTINGIF